MIYDPWELRKLLLTGKNQNFVEMEYGVVLVDGVGINFLSLVEVLGWATNKDYICLVVQRLFVTLDLL